MNKLRAKTLMAESRARQARGNLVLDVVVAIREPAQVDAFDMGLRVPLVVVTIIPERPWWYTMGLHVHRIERRASKAARSRAAVVRVAGLDTAYVVWATLCFTALVSVAYRVTYWYWVAQ